MALQVSRGAWQPRCGAVLDHVVNDSSRIECTGAGSLNFPVMAKVVVKKAAPRMTELFRRAFERAAEELPEYEQDEFANWLLRTLESDEKRWDAAFAQSGRVLDRLEAQALEDIKSGRAEPLDPDKL
jgi:hypothetical protein